MTALPRDLEEVCWTEFDSNTDQDQRIQLLALLVKIRTSRVPVGPKDKAEADKVLSEVLSKINGNGG